MADELQEILTALMAVYEVEDVAQIKKLQSKAMSCLSEQPSLACQRFYHLHEVRRKCFCGEYCTYCESIGWVDDDDDDDLDEEDIEELQAKRKEFFSYPVLWFFVKTEASIGDIKKIHEYDPKAASCKDGICFVAACQTGGIKMDNEAMFFLLKQYPKALLSNTYGPWSPLADIVWADQDITGGIFELKAIEAIFASNPKMHGERVYMRSFMYPLSRALEDDECLYPLMDFLTDNFPKDIKEFRVGFHDDEDVEGEEFPRVGRFGQYSASCLGRILPQLERLSFRPDHLTRDGLLGLMNHIPTGTILVNLELRLPRDIFDKNALETIKSALKKSTTIETLRFSLNSRALDTQEGEPENRDDDIFEAVGEAIGNMKSLTRCVVAHFELASSNKGLARFLAKAPQQLDLQWMVLQEYGSTPSSDWMGQNPRLEDISLGYFSSIQENAFRRLLGDLLRIPTLKKIYMNPYVGGYEANERRVDITDALVKLLEHKKLSEIRFSLWDRATACAQSVCRSLKENRSLEVFSFRELFKEDWEMKCLLDVVANHNTKLESLGYVPDKDHRDQIQYWLCLNQQGRRQLWEDQNLSLSAFVELVVGATPHADLWYHPYSGDRSMQAFNSQFGLLRERPSLWCNALEKKVSSPRITRKKRKRDDGA